MMADNGYSMGFGEADLKLHETLVKAAHNKRLEIIYKSANLPLSVLVMKDYSTQEMVEDVHIHVGAVEALKQKHLSVMVKLLSKGLV